MLSASYVYWLGSIIHDQVERHLLIGAIWQHIAVAMLMIVPVLAYFLSRHFPSKGVTSVDGFAIKCSRRLLNGTLMFAMLSGFLTVWARGSDVKVFDWFTLPSPVDKMPITYEILEVSHGVSTQLLLIVFTVWLLAKLGHVLTDKFSKTAS